MHRSIILLAAAQLAAAALSNTDKQFLITAARTDMIEAHEGQMAENQANRANVKDLGKLLVQDHTQSYEELTALSSKTGVSIPKGIDAARVSALEPLLHLKGDRFDRAFSRDEIAAHRRALAAFKREAEHGQDADVKAYASSMIPTLEKHLQLAEECSKAAK